MVIKLEKVLRIFDKLSNIERLRQEINKLEEQRKRLELKVNELEECNSAGKYDSDGLYSDEYEEVYKGLVELITLETEQDITIYHFGFLELGKDMDYKEEVKVIHKIY